MPNEDYGISRAREALARAKGERAKAQRLLLQWASRDERLTLALATPHLRGLAAHAVHRAKTEAAAAGSDRPAEISAQALEEVVGQLGRRIGVSPAAANGPAALLAEPRRPQAGRGHVEALRQMAVAFARKRFDP